MKASIQQDDDSFITQDLNPICGVDICDACGDCLHCYGENACVMASANADPIHMFIVYKEDREMRLGMENKT